MKHGKTIIDEETGGTSRTGVFADGDAIRANNSVVQSMQDGVIAARGISSFLERKV